MISAFAQESVNEIMSAAGLSGASAFTPAKIVAWTLFGAIGFVAFMYGKKNALWRPAVIGVALMAYPYFLSGTWPLYLIGIALTLVLYFWRE